MNKLITTVVAAAGGFVAGILLAPKSGKETRQDIAKKTEEYKGKAKVGLEKAKEGVHKAKEEVVKGAETIKKDVVSTADDVKKAVK